MGTQNKFSMKRILTTAVIMLICSTAQSLDNPRYSVKRVQRLAKIPADKFHSDLISNNRLNSTRPAVHVKNLKDDQPSEVEKSSTSNSVNINNNTNTSLHLPKTNSNQLKLRIGALSKGKPGLRSPTASSTLSIETTQELTTVLPTVTTENNKGNITKNKQTPLITTVKTQAKIKPSNLPIRNRHTDEKKVNLKRLVADSSQIVVRKLNPQVKTTIQPPDVTGNIENDTTNRSQDSMALYETTTILSPTTEVKRNSIVNHINERAKTVRVTPSIGLEKRTSSGIIPRHNVTKINTFTSSQPPVTTEKIPDTRIKGSSPSTAIKETSKRHTGSRHSHSEFPKITTVNHHITRSPGTFPRVTPLLEETLRIVTETTVASQTTKDSSKKWYGLRIREKVTNVPQEISSPTHDLAISESDSKKTYKTAPTESTTREFKHRPSKFTTIGPAKFKLRDSERESSEIKIETTAMNADQTQQTTEITDFTDHAINSEAEIPTTIQIARNGGDEMYKNTTSTSTTSIATDSITTYNAEVTRGKTEAPDTSKSTHETTEHTETPLLTRGTTETPEVVTYHPRGRRGRIVKIVRVTTQPSIPTTRESTAEITTYPTNLMETKSNVHESVSESKNTSNSHPERSQTPIRNDITENQDFTTENLIEITTVSTTTLSNSSSEEQNLAENKVSAYRRRRGHRVVKMVRKVPIESDTSVESERDSNEKEKEIILTSETMNFNRPRRIKKIIKVNRKNLSDTESTTKIPVTTLEDSEDHSVTLTTKNTDELSELMTNPTQDKTQSTYEKSDASTQLSFQETTIANDIFETTISTTQKEESSSKFEAVTEKYNRGRGRNRKRLLPNEIVSSTTEAILDTSIKIPNYDTDYDEVQDDYQINVDTDLFISSRKEKRHGQIQKRAADENSYKRSPSTSNIEDPTRNQRFVSGSDSQKNSRINKLYQRRLPSEYKAAADKYRTKYLSKISRNYEQNRDRILNKTLSNKLLNYKKDDSPYPRNIAELLDESAAEKNDNTEQTTLLPMTTYTDLTDSELEPETSKRTKNSLDFKTDAMSIPSLETRITSTKKIAVTTLEKTSAAERSGEISTYNFQTKDSSPLKISLNQPPSGSNKKVSSTRKNLVFPSTFQKTISSIFKSTVSFSDTDKNRFSSSTKRPLSSSTKPSIKSTSTFITPSTLSVNSSDVYRKHEFSTPSKQTVVVSITKSVNKESSKKQDGRNSEKVKQEKDKTPTLKEALTNRVNQVLAAVQQVAGAVIELPKQLLLLPVRLGFYPGIERKQREISKSVQFPCKQQKMDIEDVPKSVHRLQPGDIKVVASLGDSFTTANSALAESEDETSHNYRGVSAMGGGQGTWRQYLTLPNILREFNPKLLGYALGAAESNSPISGLNVAENGALDDQILRQAQSLVTKIRNNHFIDFKNDWKLVNIMIGSNDICKEYCFQNNDKDSPLGHLKHLEEALLYLKENLPRTFVNLIHIPNMTSLQDMKNIPFSCHMKQVVQCSCLFEDSKKTTGESVSTMLEGYWEAEQRVAEDERFDSEDFTVVLQPFFLGVKSPDTVNTLLGDVSDLSFFAPDCFHFSQKGYAQVANALWNNMMEPVGNKSLGWVSPLKKFMCPSEMAPYLFTKRNSQTFLQIGHQ